MEQGRISEIPYCGTYLEPNFSANTLNSEIESKIQVSLVFQKAFDLISKFSFSENPEEYIQTNQAIFEDVKNKYEKKVIVEIFNSCINKQRFMEAVYNLFLKSKFGKWIEKTDEANFIKFEVLSHYIFFDAISWTQHILYKMYLEYEWVGAKGYYRFILKESKLGSILLHEILCVYSPEYVREVILPNIVYSVDLISKALFVKTHPNMSTAYVEPRKQTIPKPFHFHEPVKTKRQVKTEEIVPFKAKAVPRSVFISPKPSESLENMLRQNRLKAHQLMEGILHLENRSRLYDDGVKSSKYYETIGKINAERENGNNRKNESIKRLPIEQVLKVPKVKPKPTVANILKVKKLYQDSEKGKEKTIDNIMFGKCDELIQRNLEYDRIEKEKQEQAVKEKRIIDAKLSYHRAINASKKRTKCNLELGKSIREELMEIQKKKEIEVEEDLQLAKRSVAILSESRRQAKEEAQQKARHHAIKLANEAKLMSEKMKLQTMKEKQNQAKMDEERVNKVKALNWMEKAQANTKITTKHKDPSSMSNAEMAFRLQLHKEIKSHDLSNIHAKILNGRLKKKEEMKNLNLEIEKYFADKKVKKCQNKKVDYTIPTDKELLRMKKELEELKLANSSRVGTGELGLDKSTTSTSTIRTVL